MAAAASARLQQLGIAQLWPGLQLAGLASESLWGHGGNMAVPSSDRFQSCSLSQVAPRGRGHIWLPGVGCATGTGVRRPAVQCNVAERSTPVGEIEQIDTVEPLDDARSSDITEWELDFCSRPILDERGRRIWELLVCDNTRTLQHAEYFPSNRINSANLKESLLAIIERYNVPKPQKVRFFRAQMQTIISKACSELDIRPVPSQRCVTLVQWLEERFSAVYVQHPGYTEGAAPLLQLETPSTQNLPDSLRGEQWAFVQLPLSAVFEEMERVGTADIFGATLDLSAMGLAGLSPETMVPGVAVASSRATPLAAWTSALELAALRVDSQRACLVLSTGVAERWRYAFYRRSQSADAEANAWEEAKRDCDGLHFLAIQSSLESEDCTGFWLMRDLPPPQI